MKHQQLTRPFKELGDVLLVALGHKWTETSLAKKLYVTPAAVHNWVSGKRRPRPGTLGQLAALLDLCPKQLAFLAGYEIEPDALEKVITAYEDRCLSR